MYELMSQISTVQSTYDSVVNWQWSSGFSVEIFKRSPRDPFVFELGVPNKISVIKSLFYTVMSCQTCASQGRIAFHFLLPKLIFCVKYAIFCVNKNPGRIIKHTGSAKGMRKVLSKNKAIMDFN